MKISRLLVTRLLLHAAAVPEGRCKVKSVCETSLFNSCKLLVYVFLRLFKISGKCLKLEHENPSQEGRECCGSLTKDTPSQSVKKKNGCADVEISKMKWTTSHAEGVTKA